VDRTLSREAVRSPLAESTDYSIGGVSHPTRVCAQNIRSRRAATWRRDREPGAELAVLLLWAAGMGLTVNTVTGSINYIVLNNDLAALGDRISPARPKPVRLDVCDRHEPVLCRRTVRSGRRGSW